MPTLEDLPFFGYGPFTEGDNAIRVLGRRLEGSPARLAGYRLDHSRGYTFLIEEAEQEVEGLLYQEMRRSDYWMLDDHHGLPWGLFRRKKVEVRVEERQVEACAYVVGPAMFADAESHE